MKTKESNKSTADLVKKHVLYNSFLIDFLKRDLINITSLARELFPEIKKENPKTSIESISIAIKRLNLENYNLISENLEKAIKKTQISLKDEVILFCLEKNSNIPNIKDFSSDELFFMNQTSNEITIIIDKKNSNLIQKEHILKLNNLSAISLKSEYRNVKGYVNTFLNKISNEGINIIDMISTHSQFTFITKEKDALKVFEICQNIKKVNSKNSNK